MSLTAILLAGAWQILQPGLELATFQGPASHHGEGRIQAVRVDASRFELKLMNAAATGGQHRSAKEWATLAGGVAATNPSMFAHDGRSVALMKAPGHVSNGHLGKDKSVLVFGAGKGFRLLDRECDDVPALLPQYESAAQGIRMLSCKGKNTWSPSPKRWSAAAVGQDAAGRLLLVHVRTAYTMHELVDALLAIPELGLRRLMYVEGGPEAQLYLRAGAVEKQFVGSYETGFYPLDDNQAAWPIPNCLVIVPRSAEKR